MPRERPEAMGGAQMSARPWMKFFPADWRSDPALRMCSLPARGLWMEMLCVMHEASPRGHLVVNGKPMQDRQLAGLAGCSVDEVRQCIEELKDAGVCSTDESGVIICRRMVRETERSEKGRVFGALGGNPTLVQGVGQGVKGHSEETLKGANNPYIASSIWPSEDTPTVQEEASPREPPPPAESLPPPSAPEPSCRIEFDMTFWPAYPHKVGRPAALRAFIAKRQGASLAEIMDGLARYKSDRPPDRQWLNPETFLNDERYRDEPAPAPLPNGTRPGGHDAILGALARAATAEPRQRGWPADLDGRSDGLGSGAAANYELGGAIPVPAPPRPG